MTLRAIKRSIVIGGRKTSISVEDVVWSGLKEIATTDGLTLSELVGTIATSRVEGSSLSRAVRAHVLGRFKGLAHILAQLDDAPAVAVRSTVVKPAGRAFGLRRRPR